MQSVKLMRFLWLKKIFIKQKRHSKIEWCFALNSTKNKQRLKRTKISLPKKSFFNFMKKVFEKQLHVTKLNKYICQYEQ